MYFSTKMKALFVDLSKAIRGVDIMSMITD